jgi:hypothetical protein
LISLPDPVSSSYRRPRHQFPTQIATAPLPEMPPPHGASYTEERTYRALLGPVDEEPTVWAECLFVDPVGDIAVLGEPDNQELPDEAEAYQALVDAAIIPVPISKLRPVRTLITLSIGETIPGPLEAKTKARMLSLDGRWFECKVTLTSRGVLITSTSEAVEGGMSGSPILDPDGAAIGLVTLGGGPASNPSLIACLPGWML